jgi:hypothetical protein
MLSCISRELSQYPELLFRHSDVYPRRCRLDSLHKIFAASLVVLRFAHSRKLHPTVSR